MIAVMHYLQIWRVYLLGTKLLVITNNVANIFFKSQKKLSSRQTHWQEFLEEYDFEWWHKPGRHNQVVDALRQREIHDYVIAIFQITTDFLDQIRTCAESDSDYQKLI